MHLRMGQTVWRPENCPKISATGWEEGPAWVAYLDRLDFLNHYTVWHHQVGMKWIEPFKKNKSNDWKSYDWQYTWRGVAIGMFFSPPMIRASFWTAYWREQLGWLAISNTTHVILHVWLRFFGGFISSYRTKQLKGSYFMIQSKWPRPRRVW